MEKVAELICSTVEDRSIMTGILVKNGYTVGPGRIPRKSGKSYDYTLKIYREETPRIYRDGYLQVGAPYSRVMDDEMGTERDTFPTFERVEKGIYRFCGNCFAGETKHIE